MAKRQLRDSDVGVCRVCGDSGYAFDIVVPGEGRARVYLCEKDDKDLREIMALGDWRPFSQGQGKEHFTIQKQDLGELLSHRKK